MASSYEKSVKGSAPTVRSAALSARKNVHFETDTMVALQMLSVCAAGATKVKLAAPKPKYIEHLLMATEVLPCPRGVRFI